MEPASQRSPLLQRHQHRTQVFHGHWKGGLGGQWGSAQSCSRSKLHKGVGTLYKSSTVFA
eukprot:1138642-Pelagomonas_calceolata.AAC.6